MGLIYNIGIRLMNFVIFFVIIILLPGVPPRTTFPFKAFTVTPAKELKGALELNYHLDGAEKLLQRDVYGPEHLLALKDMIYTGMNGGEVLQLADIYGSHIAKFGHPCEGVFEESRCGRPLGLAVDTIGNNLIVADTYYGIWELELEDKNKKLLISPQQELDGKIKRKAKAFNSVVVDKKGDIYWTDSSSDFTMEDLIFATLANPSGRLFHYDREKNVSTCLLDELFFANGLVLSPNEEFIVVAETGASRLLKYHLKGPKKGQHEVFVDGLPGTPDNLTPDEDGIWIPLITSKDADHPSMFAVFSEFPMIRLFLSRMLALFELPFRMINNVFPNRLAQKFIHFIGHVEFIMPLMPKRSTIVRVDWNGNILGSLHGFDQSVGHVSHVLVVDDLLLLGSPYNHFIAKVKLPKSPQVKIRNVRYEGANMEPVVPTVKATPTTTAQPTTTTKTTTPRPTSTTTPRPTTTTTTTTTPRPTTTTTTPRPVTTTTTTARPTTTTTQRPATVTTTTTPKPVTTTTAPKSTTNPVPTPKIITTTRTPPKNPAPIVEEIPGDTKAPPQEKIKIIKKGGEHSEL